MNNTPSNLHSSRPVPGRSIGVGLTRTKLSAGTYNQSAITSTLTTPSRVSSLSRPRTERYQSAYSRLGGIRNTSAPNVNWSLDKNRNIQKSVTKYEEYSADEGSPLSSETQQEGVSEKDCKSGVVNKTIGRTESLKDQYLSLTETRLGESHHGRRIQPSYISTPGSIDTPSPQVLIPLPSTQGVLPVITTAVASSSEDFISTDKKDDSLNELKLSTSHNTDSAKEDAATAENSYQRTEGTVVETIYKSLDTAISTNNQRSIDTAADTNTKVVYSIENQRSIDSSANSNQKILDSTANENIKTLDIAASKHHETLHTIANIRTIDTAANKEPSLIIGNINGGSSRAGFVSDKELSQHSSDTYKYNMAEDQDTTPVAMPRTRRKLTKRNISFKKVEDDEYIGFASLPEQVHRKAVRRGFEFTLMVVGETGLGKSTLINSLFLTDLYKDRKVGNTEERVHKTVDLEKKELEIEERGVKLRLTIVDTPGFNDAVNAEESWKPIVNYIDKQFETYFKAESGLNRKNIQDTRVHCCLYFISPYGHGLRPVDVSVMKKLHHKVNIVPLIAKADMLTKQEVKRLKEKVLQEVEHHKIQIYQFPDCDSDEDEEFKQQDKDLKKSIPFAVVGSNTVVEAGGKKIRGRMYPWGIVEVENPQHCDFVKLRQMLISTHMQDLKDVTCDIHYENYRAEHITEQMTSTQKERNKLKRDSTPNLDKALDTERLLQEKEQEIRKMQEMLAKMQAQLNDKNNSPQLNGKIGKT